MRVLHVFRTYIPDTRGGMQEVIRQICRSTGALGITNRVFSPSPNPEPAVVDVDGTPVVRVKLNFEIASCGFCLTGLAEFRRQVVWADVVHYHFPWPFADLMHFLVRVKKPALLTYHADIIRQQGLLKLYAPLMQRFLDSVDRIVCTSTVYRDSSPNLQRRSAKVSVIPIGLCDTSYPQVTDAELSQVRAEFGEGFFFFVGMLRYYKGLHILLDAAKDRGFKVVIAGKGPLEHELKQQAKSLGLDNVVFAGEVTDEVKVALLKLCRGVVFPSHVRAEAFGVTLLEGAMYSKPLISAETGSGTSHVNQQDETGFIVPAEDPVALGDAMEKLHKDIQLAKQLGKGARTRFESLFTAAAMGAQYVDEYRKLVAETSN
ncbi:MAG: glycosyltransferase [Pseudomonadales bacterium]